MNVLEAKASRRQTPRARATPPAIHCRALPDFAPERLETVRRAFRAATPCKLRQAWLKMQEADFAPAVVRTGWRDNSLLMFAELTDHDIFTGVTRLNQRAWELGDTFEIFLRPEDQTAYVEFHVTPNNQRLQVRFPNTRALDHARKTGSIRELMVPGVAFRSRTWVQPESQRWFIYAEIPSRSVCKHAEPLPGSRWRFSFSRYDYTRGRPEPVISSTSPHPEANFHRQQNWGVIHFRP